MQPKKQANEWNNFGQKKRKKKKRMKIVDNKKRKIEAMIRKKE